MPHANRCRNLLLCRDGSFFAGSVARAARLSDLLVFGPMAAADGADVNECFVEILTRTDRPVPLSGNFDSRLTRYIAIAWTEAVPPVTRLSVCCHSFNAPTW